MPRRKREASPTYELEDDYEDDGSGQPPIQRNAANARERARMRVLSSAFCRLKTKLPWVPPDTKLSKLDTLRLATGYIQQLQTVLAGDMDDGMTGVLRPPTLSWPFTFQQQHDMRQTSTTPSSSSDHWSPPRESPEPMIHHFRSNHSIYGAIVHGQ